MPALRVMSSNTTASVSSTTTAAPRKVWMACPYTTIALYDNCVHLASCDFTLTSEKGPQKIGDSGPLTPIQKESVDGMPVCDRCVSLVSGDFTLTSKKGQKQI